MIGEIKTSTEEWHARFYGMAQYVAEHFSKDPRRKVGAVLVSADRRSQCIGYNGFPGGTPDLKAHLLDDAARRQLMVHAELNAVCQARFDRTGSTLYVTKFPCNVCMGVVVNAGVARVVAPRPDYDSAKWGDAQRAAMTILQNAKVEFVAIQEPT